MEPTHCINCREPYRPNRVLVGWSNTHMPDPSLYKFCRECGYTTYYEVQAS